MSVRHKIAVCWLAAVAAAGAATPEEAARKALEASVARQTLAVASMRLSVAKQRAALAAAAPERAAPSAPAGFFTLSWPPVSAACDPLPDVELQPLLAQTAQKEGVAENLLRAVAEQESGMRPCAVSPKGAMGLMQLMPATARELGVRDPFDPQENLESGARFLKQLLTRFGGDPALALAAYNAGPARVDETGGVPPIPETIRYVQQILSKLTLP